MIMKKSLYILFSLAALLTLASCEKDKYGTMPGKDTEPFVMVSQITPALPYDSDCDVILRLAANNATTDVYYFAETAAQKEARNLAEEAYADYVVSNGKKASLSANDFDGSSNADVVLQTLYGEHVITAVAVNGNKKYSVSQSYTGLKWNDVVSGNYTFKTASIASRAGGSPKQALLQQLDTDPDRYRFKDLFMVGKHLEFHIYRENGESFRGVDPDLGEFTYCRVEPQDTGLTYGSYGAVSVRDSGYKNNDDSFDVELYDDNMVYLYIQYYVSAGNLGTAWDNFKPAK